MVKCPYYTTQIAVALVIGLLLGGTFMVLVQNKFFKQAPPDENKAVAKQKNVCTYTCQVSATSQAKSTCPAALQLLKQGRIQKPADEQTTDLLLVRRMNDVGWRLTGGDSKNGWNTALHLAGDDIEYECTGRGISTQTTNIVLESVEKCPDKEQVCPNGILEQLPAGAKTDQDYAQAVAEASANAQAQVQDCQKFMNKRCEKLSEGVAERYWKTHGKNKEITEGLSQSRRFCDRKNVLLLKKYTSDEKYDPLDFAKDELGAERMETIKQYLKALSNPSEISKIKQFIQEDLLNKKSEVGGGLVQGQSPEFRSYSSGGSQRDDVYGVGGNLAKAYSDSIVRSIWHIHAIDADGNPEQEGPSGDPEHPKQENDDFNSIYTLTNGEAVITYMGKDANGKICFNVKFYTRPDIVVDLGDYDP